MLGIGLLPFIFFPDLVLASLRSPHARARLLAILIVLGILLNYSLVLVIEKIYLALAAGAIFSAAGFITAFWRFQRRLLSLFNIRILAFPVALITGIYLIPIAFDPISAGDARSIWFFHGKMIYYSGGLGTWTGFSDKAVLFSHVDYPKLIAVLSAEFAFVAGFWNEFIPKASLAALILPTALAVASFLKRFTFSNLFLLLMFFFSLGLLLWNGYMDGYLALYAGITLLFLGRWLNDKDPLDLAAGIVFLALAASLKNEGVLILVSVVVSLLIIICGFNMRKKMFAISAALGGRLWIILLCSFSGICLWSWKKSVLGLENDLQLGVASIPRIASRLEDGSMLLISKWLFLDAFVLKAFVVLAIALAGGKLVGRRVSTGATMAIVTSSLYFSGIFFIYMATPANLQWHLSTSATRTMGVVLFGLFAGIYFLLQEIENPFGVMRTDDIVKPDVGSKSL